MKKIFLDQMHWIELGKFINGKPTKSGTADAYAKIQELRKDATAIFPLTMSSYFETLKQSDPARRERLSSIMRELSDGYTISDQSLILKNEIWNGLLSILKFSGNSVELKYIGKGISHIFFDKNTPELDSLKKSNLSQLYKNCIFDLMERMALVGYVDILKERVVLPQIPLENDRKFYDFLSAWKGCAKSRTSAQVKELIDSIVIADIMEFVAENLIYIERHDILKELEQKTPESIRELIYILPSRKVQIHLLHQWALNDSLKPKISDLNDWHNMCITLPYCDFVFTENQMADLLKRNNAYKNVYSDLARILDIF